MKKNEIVVSLILTTFNCENYLEKTLKSIEEQDYSNIEVVIVDGLSQDATVDIIKTYRNKSKYSVKWISENDKGIYDAMNKGYQMSSGDIIAFFNDMFASSTAITTVVNAIYSKGKYEGAHADLIYAENDRLIRYWKMGEGKIKDGWMPGHPTLFLKRTVYEKYGLYDISYKCSADYEFMVRILKEEQTKLVYIPQILIRMFYGGTSTSGLKNYFVSLKESHRALKENKVKAAFLIDIKRIVKVFEQFVAVNKLKDEWKMP